MRDEKMKNRILIGSPIRQKANILQAFLDSLENLYIGDFDIHYLFIDDNESEESSNLLLNFVKRKNTAIIFKNSDNEKYICDEKTHYWNENLVWKVANLKNIIIQFALEQNFDYLFLIDSDIVLHPNTLQQLVSANKDIISNIFWTKWQPDSPELPQVWVFDQYVQYYRARGEVLTQEQIQQRQQQFLEMLRKPGVYEVGGLGACTLISRKALQAGVNFKEIKNISFWGEDRHFCIRAQALGFDLFVDTHYPAYHIYRESDINGLEDFYRESNVVQAKINREKIIQTIIEGIEKLGTYNYLYGYSADWSIYFDGILKENLLNEAISNENIYKENKLIVKANVTDVEILSFDPNCAKVSFYLKNEGIEKGESFCDIYKCDAKLENFGGQWRITEFIPKQ
jgi:GT2 family glycosyltransferase